MWSTHDDPQKHQVHLAFTAQAETYAQSRAMSAAELRRRFVDSIPFTANATALDVACGPGFLALLLAERLASVVGIDTTAAMVDRARHEAQARSLSNVRFQLGEAEALDFDDNTFDVVTCGFAFHHCVDPRPVLAEMVRVTRLGGWIGILDIVASEDPQQAALHNDLERMRDPSHTRALPLTEFTHLFRLAGLQDIATAAFPARRDLDEWLAITRTPADDAGRIRAALLAAMEQNAAGLNVRWESEQLCFDHTFAWIIGARP